MGLEEQSCMPSERVSIRYGRKWKVIEVFLAFTVRENDRDYIWAARKKCLIMVP